MRIKPLSETIKPFNPNRPPLPAITSQEYLSSAFFTDKPGIAKRYLVHERTIENWMRQRRLPFVKCGRVVRFNIARCDAALARFEVKEVR